MLIISGHCLPCVKFFGRTHQIADLGPKDIGSEAAVGGWVEDARKMGKMTFLTIRDSTGTIQAVLKGSGAEAPSRQSIVLARGRIQETRARGAQIELAAESVETLSAAQHPLPIDPTGRLESGLDNRLNARALDVRNRRTAAIFRVRHAAMQAIRGQLSGSRFTEITTPKIIGSASEGGANLFSLEYFGRTAYLAQSPQLYKEQMTIGLERVYEISSFYRAEKSHTGRHLSEFTSVDIEAAFMDYTDVMDVLEGLIVSVFEQVSSGCAQEQEDLGRKISPPAAPFERVTYEQAVSDLQKAGQDVKFGDDLLDSHLRIIGNDRPGFFFLTDWPTALKPFYIMEKGKGSDASRSFDLQHGHLELSSGGTRLHDAAKLKARLEEQGLDPGMFAGHLEAFGWGMPPHSGWGMGLDRLVAVLVGADNVREAVLYPRDPDRLQP